MITPSSVHPALPLAAGAPRKSSAPKLPIRGGSVRYVGLRRSRLVVAGAVLISVGLHVGVLFGFGHARKKAAPATEANVIELTIPGPEMKLLQDLEPEPTPDEAAGAKEAVVISVPMQADLPKLPQLGDFVQALDYASLIERPNTDQPRIWSIPATGRHGGKVGEGLGNIFNLKDLDRAPEPVVQPPPIYPQAFKREGLDATVTVEFIVDTQGRCVNAVAIDTTHYGFNEAAMTGVEKWKFRPGLRGGRKVNTRMRVPIIFHVAEGNN